MSDRSLAVKVTIVAPKGKIAGALLETGREPSTASFAVAALRNEVIDVSVLAVPLASVAATVILAGAITFGATLSTTLIVLDTSTAALPAASLTL